jgi:hypothetical protein
MASKVSLTTEIISQAESYTGIRAGIVRLKDVLKGLSYQATPEGPRMFQLMIGQWRPKQC